MMSVNWSSAAPRVYSMSGGVALYKVWSLTQIMHGLYLYVCDADGQHSQHLIWLNITPMRTCSVLILWRTLEAYSTDVCVQYIRILLLLIFCTSQGSVVTCVICSGKYNNGLATNSLPSSTVNKFLNQTFAKLMHKTRDHEPVVNSRRPEQPPWNYVDRASSFLF